MGNVDLASYFSQLFEKGAAAGESPFEPGDKRPAAAALAGTAAKEKKGKKCKKPAKAKGKRKVVVVVTSASWVSGRKVRGTFISFLVQLGPMGAHS